MNEATITALLQTGMTEPEIQAMSLTVDCANAVLDLPKLHPMDAEEFCHAIHIVQEKLMARPAMRAMQAQDNADA